MSGVVRGVGTGLLLLVLIYLGLILYLYLRQAGMLYLPDFPGESMDLTPADARLPYEQIELTSADDGG